MWYNTVEFYVIAGAIAAAAIVAASLPPRQRQGVLHLLGGELSGSDEGLLAPPAIDVEVDDNGRVLLRRSGLKGITDNGAVSLAVNVAGFDVSIEERLTPGNGWPTVDTADFVLDFFGPERYHIKYNSEDTGLFAAFTLNVAPGIRIHKPLSN